MSSVNDFSPVIPSPNSLLSYAFYTSCMHPRFSAIQGKTFTHKGFHGVPNYFFACSVNPLQPLRDLFGDAYGFTLFFAHGDYIDWYWNTEDMDRLGRKVIARAEKDPQFISGLRKIWLSRVGKLEDVFAKINHAKLSTLSDHALLRLYSELFRAYVDEYAPAIGLQDAFSMRADVLLEPAFAHFLKQKGQPYKLKEYFAVLFAPVEPSFLAREGEDLLEIACLISRLGARKTLLEKPETLSFYPKVAKRLREHARLFFWIQSNYAKTPILDQSHFLTKALDEENPKEKLRELRASFRDSKWDKKALIDKLKLPARLRTLIQISEIFCYMQDERKKYVLISSHYQHLLLAEMSRRLDVPFHDLQYVLFHEIPKVLDGSFDLNRCAKRREFFAVLTDDDGVYTMEGTAARQLFEKHFKTDSTSAGQLSGTVAHPGKATGPVKLIRKTHDLVNVQFGDILVASMTRPEMISAMKKAAAIVTDEGG
ncbi:MAG TPA: PEP-utilizing enzyme, partial [Candidatus Norongarragalinales archaeon]|nr:PEP-utilizing enzyme [Candidatus Norongarragalinales archaeon]